MSENVTTLVVIACTAAATWFFFAAARAAGKPVSENRRSAGESPFGGPWGTLESRKPDHNLEWDEIAIMDDEFRRNEEEDDHD